MTNVIWKMVNGRRLRLDTSGSSLRLSVSLSLCFNVIDEDLVDAATIHVHHLDSQVVPDEIIRG
jgi:hypothetical protein